MDNSYLTLSILHDGSTKFVFEVSSGETTDGNPPLGAAKYGAGRRDVAGGGSALLAVESVSEAIPGAAMLYRESIH